MKQEALNRYVKMELIVGGFVFAVFVALVYFTVILSRDTWFSRKHTLNVRFEHVRGLREGDNAMVRGMKAGKVKQMTLTERGVVVQLAMDMPVELHDGYRIMISPASVLGGQFLEIDEGPTNAVTVSAEGVLPGETPGDLLADAGEVMAAIKKGLIEGGVIDNIRVASDKLSTILTRVEAGEGTLGKLLSSDDTLYRDLSETVEGLKLITERVEKGEGTLGKLLSSDDTLYKDISATAASLRDVTGRLEKGEGTLGKLLSKDDQLYTDLSSSMASVRRITEQIEKGDGLLGKLINDEALATQIQETVGEVRATVDDYREQAPLLTFTSIFFGAF